MERKHLLPVLESILEEDPSQIHSAAAIAELFPALRQKVVSQIFDEVEKDVRAELGPDWDPQRDAKEHFVETDWAKFSFTHPDWKKLYSITLESQPKNGAVLLGISHTKDKGITRNDQIAQKLKSLGWGNRGGGAWWEGHSPLPDPFTNWTTGAGIAAVIERRAELKKLLTDGFVELCTYFKNPLAKLAKTAAPKR